MTKSYQYYKNTPPWMLVVGVILAVVAFIVAATAIRNGANVLTLRGGESIGLAELAQLGNFFGGHISAFVGSTTLLVVLFFSYHQGKQQEEFFAQQQEQAAKHAERQAFLDGINLITQWDIKIPGCEQAMRLLDYYSRLALQSKNKELLLLLNTVITAQIRKNLEGKNEAYKSTNYAFACEAVEKIRPLREKDGREQRARLKQLFDPSVGGKDKLTANRSSTVTSQIDER